MTIGKFKLRQQLKTSNELNAQKDIEFPGLLGAKIGGDTRIDVPNRGGYVYVRLHGNLSELIVAYNDQVSPVYDLPVIVIRGQANRNQWKIKSRDYGQRDDWGTSPYLPSHGDTHSFNPYFPGGDIAWVYSNQFMPLLVMPSGSFGSMNAIVKEGAYHNSMNAIQYLSDTATASLASYKPTDNQAKMVLISLNVSGTFSYTAGNLFAESATGTNAYPYIPAPPSDSLIDLAAIRLVSGTAAIGWDEIYNVKQFAAGLSSSASTSTGTTLMFAPIILLDETAPTSGQAYFELTNISALYSILEIKITGKSEGTSVDNADILITINGDTTNSNYGRITQVNGATAGGANDRYIGSLSSSKTAGSIGSIVASIHNCNGATLRKDILAMSGYHAPGVYIETQTIQQTWLNTAAITSLKFTESSSNDFAAGTRCTIVGWKSVLMDGASYFTDLLDAPSSYTGSAGYGVFVNPTASALNFSSLLYASGSLHLGGVTNGIKVDAGGELELRGTATRFLDEKGQLSAAKITSPSSKIIQSDAESAFYFKDTATTADYVWVNIQFNHDRKLLADVSPHLHWWQTSSGTAIPHWVIQYRWQIPGQNKTVAWSASKWQSHSFVYSSGTLCQITDFADITPPATDGVSNELQIRIIRDTTDALGLFGGVDVFSGDSYIFDFDIHKEIDTMGSKQEYVK
jgi:hypothetical protein